LFAYRAETRTCTLINQLYDHDTESNVDRNTAAFLREATG